MFAHLRSLKLKVKSEKLKINFEFCILTCLPAGRSFELSTLALFMFWVVANNINPASSPNNLTSPTSFFN